jgi:hypothetical protein
MKGADFTFKVYENMSAVHKISKCIHVAALLLLLIVFLSFSLFGCGYRLHQRSSLPFTSVSIDPIENRTFEPKLEDLLHTALTQELLKQGISVEQGSGRRLSGVIRQFDLRVLSEKSDVAVQYEVVIKSDFRVTEESGERKEFRDIGSPFIVSFAGSGDLNLLIASKEAAAERAIRDIASEIVSVVLYQVQ